MHPCQGTWNMIVGVAAALLAFRHATPAGMLPDDGMLKPTNHHLSKFNALPAWMPWSFPKIVALNFVRASIFLINNFIEVPPAVVPVLNRSCVAMTMKQFDIDVMNQDGFDIRSPLGGDGISSE